MAPVTGRAREVVIRSARYEPGHVIVSVQDTGLGVDPATADRIFSAFFTAKAGGMGMGLSISRSLIEAHGGRLWVSPGGPHGVFQFSLPVDQRASEGEDAEL
jgi:two-component system sensor kinase FixL